MTRYTNVVDMIRDISGDELANELQALIDSRLLIKRLISVRVSKDLSLQDMADRTLYPKERIEAIEYSTDEDISFEEFETYTKAVFYKEKGTESTYDIEVKGLSDDGWFYMDREDTLEKCWETLDIYREYQRRGGGDNVYRLVKVTKEVIG